MYIKRNRTSSKYIGYGLYLYFLRFIFIGTHLKHLLNLSREVMLQSGSGFKDINPRKLLRKRKRISEFIIDETLIKIGPTYMWIWVAIEPENKQILAVTISKERTMLIAERFIVSLINRYGNHPVSTDGGTLYPQACRFLELNRHIHSSLEKSLIEGTMQYIKDRTEGFDDYFPCRMKNCKLKHVINWMNLLVEYHNKELCR